MGYRLFSCALCVVITIVSLPISRVYAYEIHQNTPTMSMESPESSLNAAAILQFIPDFISGVMTQFHSAETFIAQYTGMLNILNPDMLYVHINNETKNLNSVSGILQAIGGAFIWMIGLTVTILHFISNEITNGLMHL